ncbi:hypothetical protein [Absidia glauca]|uniref:Uncharacterized protein n=1 Tax=Absidia glauca TaxID=4829 RepID=A0A168PC20_ABSGL|nr:hypothetical protein [Absidia glauca]
MTALVHTNVKPTHRLLPVWLLRLVGVSSLAIALVRLVYYVNHLRKPTTGKSTTLKRITSSRLIDKVGQSPPYVRTPWWGARLVDHATTVASAFKPKKKLTISLKNTILWNPSQDVTISNHAFHENALALLTQLNQRYDLHLLIHTTTTDHDQIQRLLHTIVTQRIDVSRIVYCQNEQHKLDLIQNVLRPAIHIEGGWELDDGEDIIRALQSHVPRLVWVITRRRRTSFTTENIKPKDKDLVHPAVELTDSLLDSSLAREAGFMID